MDAREEILKRVRQATADLPPASPEQDSPIDWSYGQPTALDDVVDTFEENILDYKAGFVRTPAAGVAAAIVEQLQSRQVGSVVVPSGLDQTWAAPAAYDAQAKKLVAMFSDNFAQYADKIDDDVRAAAIG